MNKNNYIRNVKNTMKIMIFLFSMILFFMSTSCTNKTTVFNKEKWINTRKHSEIDIDWNVQKSMAQDLIDKNMLIGKTKSEIIQLLGEPAKLTDISRDELYYKIEVEYDGIDSVKLEYLIITLNSESFATKVIRKVTLDK